MRVHPSSPFATRAVRRRSERNTRPPAVEDSEPVEVDYESPGPEPVEAIPGAEWLSTADAADRLGVDTAEVRRRAREGDLNALKVDGAWLIDPASLPAAGD